MDGFRGQIMTLVQSVRTFKSISIADSLSERIEGQFRPTIKIVQVAIHRETVKRMSMKWLIERRRVMQLAIFFFQI